MKYWHRFLAVLAFALLAGSLPAMAADAPSSPTVGAEAGTDLVLRGDAKCTRCHDEADAPEVLSIGKTRHGSKADGRTPSCTNCHGESAAHAGKVENGKERPPVERLFSKDAKTPVAARNEACLSCHQKDAKRNHWEGSVHQARDVACSSCHQIHTPHDKVRDKKTQPEVCYACHKEQRAQVSKPSRHPIPEGKMGCSDCHNSHGSTGPKLMVRESVNATCYTCHMEKRGPFVHNHAPVTEDCALCHNPHGTTAENLLKARPPFLCQQCHTPHGGAVAQLTNQSAPPTTVGRSAVNITQGRGCLNCHTQVHGSNNPANASPNPQFNLR